MSSLVRSGVIKGLLLRMCEALRGTLDAVRNLSLKYIVGTILRTSTPRLSKLVRQHLEAACREGVVLV